MLNDVTMGYNCLPHENLAARLKRQVSFRDFELKCQL